MRSHILVHPALKVGETPLYGVFAHSATSNLIGDEDERGILRRKLVKLLLETFKGIIHRRLFPFSLFARKEIVGAPQCDAVDNYHSACDIMTAQFLLFLNVCPLWPSTLLVDENTLAEFLVPDMGSGKINGIVAQLQCQFLCHLALARTLSTGDKYYTSH